MLIDFVKSSNAAKIFATQNAKNISNSLQKSMKLKKAYKKKVDTQGCT